MSRCNRAPEGWGCTREADHRGPCAAREVPCGAQRQWLAADSLTAYADAACTLPIGHDGEHRAEVTW